jgi:translation initiation factor 2D
MLSSTFYSSHVLPGRPAHISFVSGSDLIKRSSYKKVSKFLQAMDKEGLIKTKEFKGDLSILSVDSSHPDVKSQKKYKTVGDVDAKEHRASEAAKAEASKPKPVVVTELWKPHGSSVAFFDIVKKNNPNM